MTRYIDKITGAEIDNNKIYLENDNGIIVNDGKCLKYLPAERVLTENEEKTNSEFVSSSSDNDESYYREKASYLFGVKDISLSEITYEKNSAIISDPINVGSSTYITVSADIEEGTDSSVEFYIIDGINETSVLPEEQSRVDKEKLFCGLETRFTINPDYLVNLYKDGNLSLEEYCNLDFTDFDNHAYCLSYTPYGEIHKYYPVSNSIKIKMIIRGFGENFVPAKINGVIVKRFGGEKSWN